MRRSGVLLLAAVPVLATGMYFVMPADSADAPAAPPAATAQSSLEDAKDRAERERKADDAVIAELPPGLAAPAKKELAQQLVASAEHSTTDWRTTYGSIEDQGDGCGYTAGIIGFCTGTHDLLTLVERYTEAHPDNRLASYLPALREVDGSDSHDGLDPGFTAAWEAEAEVPAFREAQEEERDRIYFAPAVRLAKLDGLGTLGQFVYFDAMVFHGPGTDADGFYSLRERAMRQADTPAEGGSEKGYLNAFLDVRREALLTRAPDRDTSRVDTAQRRFLKAGNLGLDTPLVWEMYGTRYTLP
ncbi:chitosanase [Streptomyces griseoloalbus]|uniref:Chitosanase n=1 Tax=Streptomyces griseoloalbus TaxID=67303 RepID=A0A7W8FAU4_9ACTN|nr:chitosanase [Streptomyces albaduncus]MBB5126736.1 chitosanase [Streptomyces albaduncus]GGW59617.1 chitosanase [Streptomyces albaduncus]